MNTNYTQLPKIQSQNITLLLGKSIGLNIEASVAHTKELLSTAAAGSVIYINTVQSKRDLRRTLKEHGLKINRGDICEGVDFGEMDYKHNIHFVNVKHGDLYKIKPKLKALLYDGYIQYVVINSWEFSSRNSRYRDEAIFMLKDLTDGLDEERNPVSVLVYAQQTSSEIIPEMLQHRFGKLSGLAKGVEYITQPEEEFADDSAIEELVALPEVQELSEIPDPRIGTEDEPGITDEEAFNRFLKKIKIDLTPEEIEERERRVNEEFGIKAPTNIIVEFEARGPKSKFDEESEVKEESTLLTTNDQRLTTEPTMPVINSPVTSIEELRATPVEISQMPIHQNSYPRMNAKKRRRLQRQTRENVHSDVVVK